MAEGSLLELQGLTRHYGAVRGVGPIDLELAPGIHGLLGPNGSGKTTLIKTILAFLPPTSGRCRVLGFDIATQAMQVRRLVGYMAENDVVVPGLNPAQTVRLAAELCGMSPARAHEAAAEALQAVGMGEERLHAPNRLSTGQRQQVKLAAALVHAPRLLILDEPTNGLDARARRTMLDLIAEVSREKDISVILSTHILPDVQAVCQDAVVLREGQLVAVEPVQARLVERHANRTWFDVQALGGADDFLDACKAAGLTVRAGHAGPQVAAKDASQLLQLATKAGCVLSRVVPATVGVEEAVLERLEPDRLAVRP
ncbi:MAG: ABC transporter ATP-binding protein [bacterium]